MSFQPLFIRDAVSLVLTVLVEYSAIDLSPNSAFNCLPTFSAAVFPKSVNGPEAE